MKLRFQVFTIIATIALLPFTAVAQRTSHAAPKIGDPPGDIVESGINGWTASPLNLIDVLGSEPLSCWACSGPEVYEEMQRNGDQTSRSRPYTFREI